MHIGIIVNSHTNTTLRFGNLIAERLRARGHAVDVVHLQTDVPVKSGTARRPPQFTIVNPPDCAQYDALLVGAPVWGFTAAPVIAVYLQGLHDLRGKKVLPFVTMGFPLPGMGGRQAIKLMGQCLAAAGATVLPGVAIPKLFRDQAALMERAAAGIPDYFV